MKKAQKITTVWTVLYGILWNSSIINEFIPNQISQITSHAHPSFLLQPRVFVTNLHIYLNIIGH